MTTTTAPSQVLAFAPASPAQTADYMRHKLSFHADAWDVAEDLRNGVDALVVIDTVLVRLAFLRARLAVARQP